jgi:hypothetical protein
MSEQVFVNRLEGLKEAVKYGRLMGHVLQEYSSLKGNPDLEISTKEFKTWIFNIDGYDVQFYFNRVETDYFETERNIIETLQIWSDDLYFLPFVVSFKIAMAFFGDGGMILTQILTPNRFIYCWTKMYDEENNTLSPVKGSCLNKSFLGHKYYLIKDVPTFVE